MNTPANRPSTWTFLTHHARVLIAVARDPKARVRDLADRIGITQRGVQKILADLYQAGYLTPERVGRRNHYSLNLEGHFRYRTEAGLPVRLLIDIFVDRDTRSYRG
ncbi:DNA-binding transcriptional ArsR family regulator [Nonomuraea thailandensis]|uniref:DNA-binding transcriptional ArsR family regulator n=1 Tax=Nonomuraea thailandensis TaxID=1188745 RepID=A0A9X2GY65_9ACTN|nr:winged helix-turn-helix domain-containing protein [Nonomuraea thailandensis]MCP2365839.1 DNA-binding transcriptional ArsR family regulator [Nonomuraea thailandensis]